MVEQFTLDGNVEPADVANRRLDHHVPLSMRPNPMVVLHGPGPADAKCGTCVHLDWKGGHESHRYYGCELRGKFTNGPATDHLVRWPACSRYLEDIRRP